MGRLMGLDYGSKTVGVALSDLLHITANSFEVVRRPNEIDLKETIARIVQIAKEQQVEKIVLGLPKHMNGDEGDSAEKVRKFKEKLEKEINIPIVLWDERLTTVESHNMMKEAELAVVHLSFSGKFYPSIHYKYFKIAEPKQYQHVVDYVVNQYMDSKFDIKAKGSLYGAMTQLCNTCISTYGDKFFTQKIMSDEDYVYWIQQVHTRIDSLIKNCASAYYECYQKKLYMHTCD